MDNEKKKLIKDYVLKVLLILSLLMITIPVVIAAFCSNILVGICVLGVLIAIPTIIFIVDDD
jgi:hypothetical protein